MIETRGTHQTSAFFSRLGAQECERIHAASLEILERVGVEVHDETARERLWRAMLDLLREPQPEEFPLDEIWNDPQYNSTRQDLQQRFIEWQGA